MEKQFIQNDKISIQLLNSVVSYDENTQYEHGINVIVGGNSLGRGVTFPQLQTIYYCRVAKSPQADTMWQHNHSQKLLSFRYNIDTNRVEARFTDGSAVANRMPNCLRTSSTRYFTVGLTRRIECHRFFMATAENHCNVFCVTNWSSE